MKSPRLLRATLATLSSVAMLSSLSASTFAQTRTAAAATVKIITPSVSLIKGQTLTLTGTVPEGATELNLEHKESGVWTSTPASISIVGTQWVGKLTVPITGAKISLRAVSASQIGNAVSFKLFSPPKLPLVGPGNRLLGADLSRWQHSARAINFAVMKKAGMSFVILKASDGWASEDHIAKPLVLKDSAAAHKAGLYVGYYHRARLPVTNVGKLLKADALKQAKYAAGRLQTLGGYTSFTLPYALDIEGVDNRVKPASLTLWMTTWVTEMNRLTKRPPIVYSYRTLLANRVLPSPAVTDLLRQSHLWLAQPGNPADPKVLVGKKVKGPGCFVTAWTFGTCQLPWTMWQYTNSGDREKFGIPWSPRKGKCPTTSKFCIPRTALGRFHLDLNVFNGSSADLAALARGTLNRSILDYR